MISIETIKTLLGLVGISQLEVGFDKDQAEIIASFVFRGESTEVRRTFAEIEDAINTKSKSSA